MGNSPSKRTEGGTLESRASSPESSRIRTLFLSPSSFPLAEGRCLVGRVQGAEGRVGQGREG